ncbi:glycerophosphodiester phosphodiesterase [Flavobacteriaceae bacterium F08102]|nr:glycerophosphodiester phosphodiesterase [Flavobacteriaceae bacterium F08102]
MNKVIAHRGAWKTQGFPENSMASLKEAIRLGCYGSEFDVHLTKDEIVVVNHDADFLGMDIESSTYEELTTLRLPNNETIPTLEAFLKEGLQHKTKLILEIKTASSGLNRTLKLTELVVTMVQRLEAQSLVEYICFSYEVGQWVKKLDPKALVAYLNGDVDPLEAKEAGYTGIDYNYTVYQQHPEWIRKAHVAGMSVNVWTVNTKEAMRKFLSLGVDLVTTNEPEKLFEVLSANKS